MRPGLFISPTGPNISQGPYHIGKEPGAVSLGDYTPPISSTKENPATPIQTETCGVGIGVRVGSAWTFIRGFTKASPVPLGQGGYPIDP